MSNQLDSTYEWFPHDEPLREHELTALRFLVSNGPHQVGIIDDEEKFAAAMVLVALTHKGCVVGGINNDGGGPTYRLTAKGRSAASGTLTEGGDVEQAPSDSLSGPTGNAGDAQ